MKGIIVISAVLGLTLVGLYLVARSKGLTLTQYVDSLWSDFKGNIKMAQYIRQFQAEEKKEPFG